MRRLLALLLVALPLACTGGAAGDDTDDEEVPPPGPSPSPSPSPTVTAEPSVPMGTAPPVGVTWHVGFTENVPRSRMQSLFASFVAANNAIWNVSEAQVRVARVKFYDAVAPGMQASQFFFGGVTADTSNIDILVFSPAAWDVPATGAVGVRPAEGRAGRLMAIPENVSTFILLHEGSHFLFRLSWNPGPLLVDEYQDGVQDIACVMEAEKTPHRWCSDGNHVGQTSQPHSCWRQILFDYPSLRHAGTDTAPSLPATPVAEYHDTP
ncbi:MAG: hypothetical protein L6Q95_13355 [Planctomycetes bacterium]|nr:hypothetical protein [Planctomycetota bacterium]